SEAELDAVLIGNCFLCVADDADATLLVQHWNLHRPEPGELNFVEASEPLLVEELFPELATTPGFPEGLVVQPCESLWLERRSSETGSVRTDISQYFRDKCFYCVGERDDAWILDQIAKHFPNVLPD